MWWNWIIACWLGSPCVTPLSALDFKVVVEEWHPSCFEQHVAERNDADEFERLAFAWLLSHEGEIAADIANERGLNLIYWWHDVDFLSCDRNTLATEVPVWFFDKRLGATVTGHIDVLMANFGKLWVLDYKPRAAKENPAKVASQLALYAQALVYRAGVNRQDIRCAWFDDRDCFTFAP